MYKSTTYRTKCRRVQNELSTSNNNILLINNYYTTICGQNQLAIKTDTFKINLYNPIDNIDHTIDFEQIIQDRTPQLHLNETNERPLKDDKETNIKQAIGKWAVDLNVPQNINELLKVLKYNAGL